MNNDNWLTASSAIRRKRAKSKEFLLFLLLLLRLVLSSFFLQLCVRVCYVENEQKMMTRHGMREFLLSLQPNKCARQCPNVVSTRKETDVTWWRYGKLSYHSISMFLFENSHDWNSHGINRFTSRPSCVLTIKQLRHFNLSANIF